ncbi:hypothetical protein Tsubulata_010561 [Turnera subulata]|uniref:Casparian strip membrane protein domain-containing protein n=1 Tax=Turnera subulata TaxID=218843 RepID=A0A9Q0JBP9_9ROSI|nr:hypothetical protein Tsubulata_010561 [Turnera subulata]
MRARRTTTTTTLLCSNILQILHSHNSRIPKLKQVSTISSYYYYSLCFIKPHLFATSATEPSQPSPSATHQTRKTQVGLSSAECTAVVQSVISKCSHLFDKSKGKREDFVNSASLKDFILDISNVIPDVARRFMRALRLLPEDVLEILLGFQFECERVEVKGSKVESLWDFFKWARDQDKGFRHLPESCEVMASILVRFGMFREVQVLLLTMERQGISLDNSGIFGSLVEGYVGESDVERAVLVYDRMREQGLVPSPLCYGVLLDLLVRMKRPNLASRVCLDMLRTGIDDLSDEEMARFENVVRLLCRYGMIQEASNLTKKVMALGFEPSNSVLNDIAGGYCEKKDFGDLLSFFVRTNCSPNILTGNKIIRSLCSNFGVESANSFRLELEDLHFRPDEITFGILISGCCSERNLRKAFLYLSEMLSRGLTPDTWTYNALLGAVFREGLWQHAQLILDEMVDRGTTPVLSTYKVLLAGYCKFRQFDKAKMVVLKMVTSGLVASSPHDDPLSKAFAVLGLDPLSVRLRRDNDVRFSNTEFYDNIGNGLYLDTNLEDYEKKVTEIIENSLTPDFSLLIKEACNLGNFQAALLMSNEMSRWGQDLSLSALSALVRGLKFRSYIKIFGSLMEKMPKLIDQLDQEALNLLVQAYSKNGSVYKAWIIFNQMLQRDLSVKNETYTALLMRLCKKGNLPILHNFWDIARTGNWLPVVEDFNTVVECLCSHGMLKETLELLQSMLVSFPNSRLGLFHVYLEKLSVSGSASIAHMLVEGLLNKGYVLDDIAYSNMIGGLCKEKKHEVAFTILDMMLAKGLLPSADVSPVLISELCRVGKYAKALVLREAILKEDPRFSFSIDCALIKGFCIRGKLVEAANLFLDMLSKGLLPDVEIYDALFQGYCQANDSRKASELLGMLIRKCPKISLSSFRYWVRLMCLEDRVVCAMNLKDVMLGETEAEADCLTLYNILIFYLFASQNSMVVNEVFTELQERRLTPNKVTYDFLTYGFANCKDVSSCLYYLSTMISQGFRPSYRSLSAVITRLCDDGQLGKALELSQEMEFRGWTHGSVVQNVIVEGLLSHDKIQKAESFLDRLMEKDLIPDTINYDNLIKRFCYSGRLNKAVDLLNVMLKKGNTPNSASYDSIIHSFCSWNQLDRAMSFHDEMLARDLRPSIDTWDVLISKLCEHGLTEEAEKLVMSMVRLGETPTRMMYSSVIDGYRSGNNPRKASKLMQMMQQSGYEPDFDTQWSLISNLSSSTSKDNKDSSQGFLSRLLSGGAFPHRQESTAKWAKSSVPKGVNRGVSILDFILRILAFIATLGSAIAMATTNETLPFFTQFIRFRAEYDDLPTLTFFVVANGIVSGYLLLSLPLSIFNIVRSSAQNSRVILVIFDTAMLALLTAGASAAAAIVYLAHNGNPRANWFAICQQFNAFCERISGSLIGSFIGVAIFVVLILLSAVALTRRR